MTAQARLWWVRHGPTHLKTICGWTDASADLSDGDAVARLRNALPASARLVSSDLTRARQTAAAIRSEGAEERHRDLRELHFGDWEGLTAAAVAERAPDLSRRFWTGESDLRAPGGESWSDLRSRVDRVEAALLSRGGDTVVVAHMGVILTRLQVALGLSVHQAMSYRVEPLSVTRIDHFPDGHRRVVAGPAAVGIKTS